MNTVISFCVSGRVELSLFRKAAIFSGFCPPSFLLLYDHVLVFSYYSITMSTRIRYPESMPVYTENPENEMWDYITDFESKQFIQNYIPKRVNTLIHMKIKTDHEFIREEDSVSIAIEVSNNAKQARDFFFISKQLNLVRE